MLARRLMNLPAGEAATDPYWDDVVLLLHMDGSDGSTTFTDSSQSAHSITANGSAEIDTAIKEYGTGSAKLDVTGSYLDCGSSADFAVGTGDFTIEWSVYFNSLGTDDSMVTLGTSASSTNWQVVVGPSGSVRVWYNGLVDSDSSTGVLTTGTWHKIAFVGVGSALYVYVDGTRVYNQSYSYTYSDTGPLRIGVNRGGTNTAFDGYIDEVRFTKGVARFTGSSYTVADEAFSETGREPFYSNTGNLTGWTGGAIDSGFGNPSPSLDARSLTSIGYVDVGAAFRDVVLTFDVYIDSARSSDLISLGIAYDPSTGTRNEIRLDARGTTVTRSQILAFPSGSWDSSTTDTGATHATGTWHSVRCEIDSSGSCEMIVNGSSVQTRTLVDPDNTYICLLAYSGTSVSGGWIDNIEITSTA